MKGVGEWCRDKVRDWEDGGMGKKGGTYCSILERARMEASCDLEVKATMEMPASMWTAREKSWWLERERG